MLDKAGQQHLLPYRSPRQFIAFQTAQQRQGHVSAMASLQSQKYGLRAFEGFKKPLKEVNAPLKNQYLDDVLRGSTMQKPSMGKRSVSHMGMLSPTTPAVKTAHMARHETAHAMAATSHKMPLLSNSRTQLE